MSRIIQDRKERGQLPRKFEKFVGMKGKNFPTVRSVVSPDASTSLVIEADYQTAEMVALAYVSGDSVLLKLLTEPDDCFAIVKPEEVPSGIDPADCVVRIKFPDYVTNPKDKDKYIMTYASDGVIHAKFTEDQLLRDENGNIVSPKFDSHWQIVEMSRHHCREELNKKKDRGAGKVANFCLAGDTKILTNTGLKLVTEVTDNDLLWDGENWVKHGGVVSRGVKQTIEYMGLRATPDHAVYTDKGCITIFDAFICGVKMIRSGEGGSALRVSAVPKTDPAYTLEIRRLLLQTPDYLSSIPGDYFSKEPIEVFDILDAGPRNRFTANNMLVSNSSSYGGTAGSIARKIEQDTGNKLSEDDAQQLLNAIEARQPRATQWFKEMEEMPKTATQLVAASGRIRHLHTISSSATDVSTRTKESITTALGRECRNFP